MDDVSGAAAGDTSEALWSDLAGELDSWAAAGRAARLWWRDDDATDATPELERLFELARDVPLGLAVIPAHARPELAARLASVTAVTVFQHGWAHTDHDMGDKKNEYPPTRSAAAVLAELRAGRGRLAEMFGARFAPIFVPPWNRFAAAFVPLLAEAGMIGLSAMARSAPSPLPAGVAAIDADIDLVAWRGHRGFIGEGAALAVLLRELRARRTAENSAKPVGILTHHLVMDRPAAAFLERLCPLAREHNGARWTAPGALAPA